MDVVKKKRGSKNNPLLKTVCNIGFRGIGEHITYINGKHTKQYTAWCHMINRCYGKSSLEERPTYKGCAVVPEWHNFQNFAEWFCKNNPNNESEIKYHLDKDLLFKGNKIYSPETCCFVPQRINSLLVNGKKIRGDLPIGVSLVGKKFHAMSSNGEGKRQFKHLGNHDTPELAFEAYKIYKENIIVTIAKEYFKKNLITEKVYKALINYKIEITD